MAQLVKRLLCKHKDLSLIPRTPTKKANYVAHAYNPSAGKVGTNGHWGLMASQPHQISKFQSSEDPDSKKNKVGGAWRKCSWDDL